MSNTYDMKDNYLTFDTSDMESEDPIYGFAVLLYIWCEVAVFYNFRSDVKKFETDISIITSNINSVIAYHQSDKVKLAKVKNNLKNCINQFIEGMSNYKKFISSHKPLKDANTFITIINNSNFSKRFFVRDYEKQVFSECENYLEKLIKDIDSIPNDNEMQKKKTTYLEDAKKITTVSGRDVATDSLGKCIYKYKNGIAVTFCVTTVIIIFARPWRWM